MTFVPPGEQLLKTDFPGTLAQLPDVCECVLDLPPPAIRLGDDPRDGATVASDDDGLSPLNFVQKLRQAGLCIGGLYLAHAENSKCDRPD